MSDETTNTPTDTDEAPTAETASEDVDEDLGELEDSEEAGDDDPRVAKHRKEAATWRRRLRETEAQLEGYRRRDIEAAAEKAGLHAGSDLWAGGVELGDMLGEDGAVDETKVEEAVVALLEVRPHWKRQPSARRPGLLDGGARQTSADITGPSLGGIIKDRSKGR